MDLLKTLEAEQMKALRAKAHPDFRPGDTLKVNVKVVDVTFDEKTKQNKTRERLQAFEGVCIARQGQGLNEAFTVRKISYGEGVERVFPVYSPLVDSITVVRKGKRTQRMAAFDYAAAQGDRPRLDENFLVREDGGLMSHDNGTSFVRPTPGKTQFIQSNFVVAHLNEPLDPELLDRLRSTDLGRLTDRLYGAELDTPDVEGTIARVTEMREEGRITGRAWDGLVVDSEYAVKYPSEAPSIEEWIRSTGRGAAL